MNPQVNESWQKLMNYQSTELIKKEFKRKHGGSLSTRKSQEISTNYGNSMAVIHADEASHWDGLYAGWQVERINHSEAYSLDGRCTNQVESYFSRLRRMIQGQHHHVSPQYLYQFGNHAAWLEDHRRESNGGLFRRLLGLSMAAPVSRQWKGYWQKSAK